MGAHARAAPHAGTAGGPSREDGEPLDPVEDDAPEFVQDFTDPG